MYKQAIRLKLRFTTTVGSLSLEQVADLNKKQLADALKMVKKILKKTDDDELSFLDDAQIIDVENQLRFDILKDMYLTKKKEAEEAITGLKKKQHNQEILALITDKKNEQKKNMSIEELEKLLIE